MSEQSEKTQPSSEFKGFRREGSDTIENRLQTFALDGLWPEFVSALKAYPSETQQQHLTKLFGHEGANFPNSESLAIFWTQLININWFSPLKKPNQTFLQEQINAYYKTLKKKPLPINWIKGKDWKEATTASDESQDTWNHPQILTELELEYIADASNREEAVREASKMAGDFAFEAAKSRMRLALDNKDLHTLQVEMLRAAERICAQAAGWIVVEDLMPKKGYKNGNPLLPLIEIYKKGYWPIGQVYKNFVIFDPTKSQVV